MRPLSFIYGISNILSDVYMYEDMSYKTIFYKLLIIYFLTIFFISRKVKSGRLTFVNKSPVYKVRFESKPRFYFARNTRYN